MFVELPPRTFMSHGDDIDVDAAAITPRRRTMPPPLIVSLTPPC